MAQLVPSKQITANGSLSSGTYMPRKGLVPKISQLRSNSTPTGPLWVTLNICVDTLYKTATKNIFASFKKNAAQLSCDVTYESIIELI